MSEFLGVANKIEYGIDPEKKASAVRILNSDGSLREIVSEQEWRERRHGDWRKRRANRGNILE